MRLIVYGDIHGCIEEFKELRTKINPQESDEEISIGDLVDKGENSLEVLRYARENGIKSILGNHEKKYIKYRAYKTNPKKQQPPQLNEEQIKLYEQLNKDDFVYLQNMPYFIKKGKLTLIHAGLTNDIRLEKTTSPKELDKTNWIRCINEKQKPVSLEKATKADDFWTKHYDGKQGYIVYGHSHFDEVKEEKFSLGIDTGCVYGGKLTAVVFQDINDISKKEIISVKAKKVYSKIKEKEMLENTQFAIAYPFIYDKNRVLSLLDSDVYKKREMKKDEMKNFMSYASYILQSPHDLSMFPCVIEEKDKKYKGIFYKNNKLMIKDKFIVCTDSDIAILVHKFEPIEDISYEDYISLHHTITTLSGENKTKITLFAETKYPNISIKCNSFDTKEAEKKQKNSLNSKHFELIKLKEKIILLYKASFESILDEREIQEVANCLNINKDDLKEYIEKKLDKLATTYININDYMQKMISHIEKKSGFSFGRANLYSYHLLDNGTKSIHTSVIEALSHYRNKLKDIHNEPLEDIRVERTSKDICTYSNGNVVVHHGKNIFKKVNGQTNLSANYNEVHYWIFIIYLIQSLMIYKLISNALFYKFDKSDKSKMNKLKEDSLHFLSHVNFEKISHNTIHNRLYKFYRECFGINSMKEELMTIVEKVGNELEKRHKEKIELWLMLLTISTGVGALLAIPGDFFSSIEAVTSWLLGK